jgi:RHS repeat-associated protein
VLWARQIAPESPSWACFRTADPPKIPIDPNGNLTTKTEGTDTWTYTWNAENQLTRVEKNSIEQARFSYDPLGRRVEKIAGGVTTSYTYDEDDVLREVRGSTTLKYVHGPAIDEPLAADDGASLSSFHADALGSVVRMTNATGAVTLTRMYDAWGTLETGGNEPGYSFTGREWDPETGLYYYRARYLDPRTGRFATEDPIRFAGGVNFYSYAGNDPGNNIDPFGLKRTWPRLPPHQPPPPPRFPCSFDEVMKVLDLWAQKPECDPRDPCVCWTWVLDGDTCQAKKHYFLRCGRPPAGGCPDAEEPCYACR